MTLLIGHRGVGKSSLIERLRAIGHAAVDLDREIESRENRSICEIFASGEDRFREIERQTLAAVTDEGAEILAVGAGFLGPIPEGARVVWVHRATDYDGRSFLNRPRLNPGLSPLEEYRYRLIERDSRFANWASEHLMLPEGYECGLEDFLLDPGSLNVSYDLSLTSEYFSSCFDMLGDRNRWGVRRFELRDDLLPEAQLKVALERLPREKLLWARRRPTAFDWMTSLDLTVDWACEMGVPQFDVEVLSLHERRLDWRSTLREFSFDAAPVMKLAVEVETWTELWLGHLWWQENPEQRAFLPRSKDGRWQWYRSLFGPKMPIHYFREFKGTALDQPYLWQCRLQPQLKGKFAAVLGQPVHHSRTPMEQRHYFSELGAPIVAIPLSEQEIQDGAVQVLKDLGMAWAAVTSPLKKAAVFLSKRRSARVAETEALNTLALRGNDFWSENTDVMALEWLAHEFADYGRVAIWGGGGTLGGLHACWPNASAYSSRSGELRWGEEILEECDLLIWAAGERAQVEFPKFKVKEILDLSYQDSSPAKEWAVQLAILYHSGLEMFKLQAAEQRRFWSEG